LTLSEGNETWTMEAKDKITSIDHNKGNKNENQKPYWKRI
jgi:hypothetical protein